MSDRGYIWETERIRLRSVRPEDAGAHWRWNQDSATLRALDRLYFPQSEDHARRWAEEESRREPAGDTFSFEIETLEGVLLGNISTHHCDPRCGTFSYGVAILPEHQRRGYAAEAMRLVLRFYFGELRYQKVTTEVYSFNEASILLHRKLGFVQEGCLRRTVYTNGRYFDRLLFGLTVEEFTATEPSALPFP